MISIDCSELSSDEKLALASSISDSMEGRIIAISKGDTIVFDELVRGAARESLILPVVREFVGRRKNSDQYSIEVLDGIIYIHSSGPITAGHERQKNELPPNLRKCPFCGFLSQYDVELMNHVRVHGTSIG